MDLIFDGATIRPDEVVVHSRQPIADPFKDMAAYMGRVVDMEIRDLDDLKYSAQNVSGRVVKADGKEIQLVSAKGTTHIQREYHRVDAAALRTDHYSSYGKIGTIADVDGEVPHGTTVDVVLDADGNGGFSDVIAGIEWAASHGIKVANMSLGADEGSEALKRAVTAASKAGLTIVAAAGNSGSAVGFPASYPETIAVAASDIKDGVAEFSSRGPEVDFIAPGVDVKSVKMGGGYVELSGTSMATPHVAGLAALAVARGARTPAALRAALVAAATPLPKLTNELQGRGMINAAKLIR